MKDIEVRFADGREVRLSDRDFNAGDELLSARFLNAYRTGEVVWVAGIPCRITSWGDERPNTIRVEVTNREVAI